jgi:hypothetical protein
VQVSPCIGPLDRELVKLILRMLKSATFQGAAPLLAAIASTNADTHAPVGLLKVRKEGAAVPVAQQTITSLVA